MKILNAVIALLICSNLAIVYCTGSLLEQEMHCNEMIGEELSLPQWPNYNKQLIKDVLFYLDDEIEYSDEAGQLLYMIGSHESYWIYDKAIKGNDLGVYQMSPGTFSWLTADYLRRNPALNKKVIELTVKKCHSELELRNNILYATALARVYLKTIPSPLPCTDKQLAMYAKKFWNTSLGKASYNDYLLHSG